jgi:hypothetical protein
MFIRHREHGTLIRALNIGVIQATVEQNYLQFSERYYKHINLLAMSAPRSRILVEAYTAYNTCNIVNNIHS